ncbi:unnamed protein product [Orchesella dallaii]|uniref:MADF domain-containing protein n=1 Tax=Orchesella dallaii TaxID=48710 RepID=A0ABP1RSU7_9HEXA
MARSKVKSVKKPKINDELKRKLAKLVQERPCLWQLSHEDHRKHDPTINAWAEIGVELGIEVQQCRDTWKSLKDGLRYHRGPNKPKGKSGDAIADVMDRDDETQGGCSDEEALQFWKFWDVMEFMESEKPDRKTISSFTLDDVAVNDVLLSEPLVMDSSASTATNKTETSCSESMHHETPTISIGQLPESAPRLCRSTNGLHQRVAKKRKGPSDKSPDDRLADSIQCLVEMKRNPLDSLVEPAQNPEVKLKYYSMYLNIDRMLQKLPEDHVEEINFQFISLIREQLKVNASK